MVQSLWGCNVSWTSSASWQIRVVFAITADAIVHNIRRIRPVPRTTRAVQRVPSSVALVASASAGSLCVTAGQTAAMVPMRNARSTILNSMVPNARNRPSSASKVADAFRGRESAMASDNVRTVRMSCNASLQGISAGVLRIPSNVAVENASRNTSSAMRLSRVVTVAMNLLTFAGVSPCPHSLCVC